MQGDHGEHFFLLEEGECTATVRSAGAAELKVMAYRMDMLSGDIALLQNAPRAASAAPKMVNDTVVNQQKLLFCCLNAPKSQKQSAVRTPRSNCVQNTTKPDLDPRPPPRPTCGSGRQASGGARSR